MSNNKPWFKEWFDKNYLLVYGHRNTEDAERQVRLIMDTLGPSLHPHSTILDLGCGTGRYTQILDNRGFRVVGLDLSETLLEYGIKCFPHLHFVVGDMRCIPGHYDMILSLFTSFGYFEKDEENRKVVESVHGALYTGGIFWLDFLNATYVENNLVKENHSLLGENVKVMEKRKIKDGRIIKDIILEMEGEEHCYRESIRLFTREELEDIFEKTGFMIRNCFGDYLGNEWGENGERTILVGEKR